MDRALPPLSEAGVDPDPAVQFRAWLDEEVAAGLRLPVPMLLGTATRDGQPSARTVLLNRFDARGFAFYTNYESRKGRALAENPRGVLLFVWAGHARQVCVEGPVEKLSAAESDEYFRGRPRDSQLSAWASRQSAVIGGREVLDVRVRELEEQFRDRPVPRPPYWGGYRLIPETIEFWQGRTNRLHDRLRYRLLEGRWRIERLSP
ncbi:MAG: pyridoxamine 5'-phosphate oxidase [Bacillati bacterium ANGP1]|uniref:Pyridoxamine 5'-phosphate oxidase n=1 Tax=Candidatus Segetimicrobium genomatis TaxID=2569760 RepID=A0A537JEJ1_9BACT|nr:MAG: pyridoxamine 5'-phosphate oxidase [Terrabacteria group bacterium ANGP1]